MEKETYENSYKNERHFSFGKNWQDFLKSLDQERVENAKKSLVDFLGGEEKIKGKTFIDIGCGSGLFSLAAYKLGAAKVVSVDVDDFSIACVKHLKEKQGNPSEWEILKGSVLNENFINSLGKFDIIYSWGVLHHTGNMYKAFDNVASLMSPAGVFYNAIYGRSKNKFGGTSEFWLSIKKKYNSWGLFGKKIIYYLYAIYFFIDHLILLKNPFVAVKNYKARGMNWRNDVIDWLGGYPYEFAWPEEVINYFGKKGIYCKKITNRHGLACNEYLMINSK